MAFNFRNAGAAMGGAQSQTTPFITGLLDRAQKSKARDDRQTKITDAYKSLYPQADPQQLKAITELMLQGASVPTGFRDQVLQGQTIGAANKDRLAALPPEERKIVSTFTPEQQNKFFEERGYTNVQKVQQAEQRKKDLKRYGQLKDSDLYDEKGRLRVANIQGDPALVDKWTELNDIVNRLNPRVAGDDLNEQTRNSMLTGQRDGMINGPSPVMPSGLTKEQSIVYTGISIKAANGASYASLTPEQREYFDFVIGGKTLNGVEGWNKYIGTAKYGGKMLETAAASMRGQALSLMPLVDRVYGIGSAMANLAAGDYDKREDGTDPDKLIRENLQLNFNPDGSPKTSRIFEIAMQNTRVIDFIERSAGMKGDGQKIWNWLSARYFEANGAKWLTEWDSELIGLDFSIEQIEGVFKPAMRYMVDLDFDLVEEAMKEIGVN